MLRGACTVEKTFSSAAQQLCGAEFEFVCHARPARQPTSPAG
jgi:hypothetical protein